LQENSLQNQYIKKAAFYALKVKMRKSKASYKKDLTNNYNIEQFDDPDSRNEKHQSNNGLKFGSFASKRTAKSSKTIKTENKAP